LHSVRRTYSDPFFSVRTGQWVGDCFVYTNSTNRLNYLVGDQTYTISHFDSPHYVLGYLPRDGRVYVADKDVQIVSFALSISVIEYQTLVLRGELDSANEMLPDIPDDQKAKIARFLEGQGYKEQALEVATDPEHRFELALSLNQLQIALELAREADVEHKWKTVGDAALNGWNMALAEECFVHAKDTGSLLLLYTSTNNEAGLRKLAAQADEAGARNVAFSCLWQIGDVSACIDLLVRTNRTAEAVLFAQTYMPSRAAELVKVWRESLSKSGKNKVSRMIAQPPLDGEEGDRDLFPEWDEYLQLEQQGKGTKMGGQNLIDVGDEVPANGETTEEAVEKAAPVDVDAPEAAEEEEAESPQETDV